MSEAATVLIAEDERAIADVVRMVVEDAGYVPLMAIHGRQALELALTESPSLVITDLMMPHMSGAEFIAALRADAARTGSRVPPVVLITALNARQAQGAGADAVLYKPFDLSDLDMLLQRFLGKPPE